MHWPGVTNRESVPDRQRRACLTVSNRCPVSASEYLGRSICMATSYDVADLAGKATGQRNQLIFEGRLVEPSRLFLDRCANRPDPSALEPS
jgi:hypothetical protein